MKGGGVTNNIAKGNGGGIDASGLTMSAGEVSGNKAEFGGGVYVYKGSEFTMSGGNVTGNEAEFVGGGVYVEGGATFTQGKGVISGNTAGDGEGEDVFKQ
jgi:hypothetical protein